MSIGSNRARAKLAAKRRGSGRRSTRTKRVAPSTAPFQEAAALTGGDVADLQRAIDSAPTAADCNDLDEAASELERPHQVTLHGECGECGSGVTVAGTVTIPAVAAVATTLRDLSRRLSRFDGRVLQRVIDHLGEGASLWFTKGSK